MEKKRTTSGISPDFAGMIDSENGQIARDIFMDANIFEFELERIFGRCWLFLAHESQIPNPNDYIRVKMGLESVLVCRNRQGGIEAFMNSCRHRGMPVCRTDIGNTKSFVCPYHGWTYDTSGSLINVPGKDNFYHGNLPQGDWGLPKVAKIANYGGLIFGTLDSGAPSLDEYLGDMRWGLDLLLVQGDLVAVPGITRWVMGSNWKFPSDNSIGDMYHAPFTHRSALMAGHAGGTGAAKKASFLNPVDRVGNDGLTVVTEYGHGLTASFISEQQLDLSSPMSKWRQRPQVKERLGDLGARVSRANMNVFPNLFVNSGSREVAVHNPLSATSTEAWKIILVDKNADPDVIRKQVQASNRHFGPAGVFEQDDTENWEQCTLSAVPPMARRYPLHYAMGLGTGEVRLNEPGMPPHVRSLFNEHSQLWFYRCWADYMSAKSWETLKQNHQRPAGTL